MTTATWRIANLEREADGFVFTAHYTVDASDGIHRTSAYGSVGFERPISLIPYSSLTEDQVLGWVKQKLGDDAINSMEDALIAQLDEQRKPSKMAGIPWQE